MVRSLGPILLAGACLAVGCSSDDSSTKLVPNSPFGAPPAAPPAVRAAYSPAAVDVAARVDQVGSNILAANKQVGIRPLFRTIGSPQLEIFHRGTAELNITEGLVRQCTTDGQLAAVLCTELGKMMSERIALSSPWTRSQEHEPPMYVPISGDNGADQTRLAELGMYEKDRRRSGGAAPLPPDPQVLARTYLTTAGFNAADLETVAPLLRTASGNNGLEKQLTAPNSARPWTK